MVVTLFASAYSIFIEYVYYPEAFQYIWVYVAYPLQAIFMLVSIFMMVGIAIERYTTLKNPGGKTIDGK